MAYFLKFLFVRMLFCAVLLLAVCFVVQPGYCVDYEQQGRVQSSETLPPVGPACPSCDLQDDADVGKQLQPAEKKTEPIIVYADRLFFDEKTGNGSASGDVIIEYQGKKVSANAIFGNSVSKQGIIPGELKIFGDRINISGQDLFVDERENSANIKTVVGTIGTASFNGESAQIQPKKITLNNAILVGCSDGDVPMYHISADTIEVYPEDKIILRNTHVFFKNVELYSFQGITVSLKKSSKNLIPYPSVGYMSNAGFMLTEPITVPIGDDKSQLEVNIVYATQMGFIPSGQFIYSGPVLEYGVFAGYITDDQGNWMQQLPNLFASTEPVRIGNWPLKVSVSGSVGIWQTPTLQSFHRMAQFYAQGDTINFSKSAALQLGLGALSVWDGAPPADLVWSQIPMAPDSVVASPLGDAVFTHKLSDSLNYALEMHYQWEKTNIFNWNNPNATVAGVWGVNWQPFASDLFNIRQTINMATITSTQLDTSWIHNWHCWTTTLTYHWQNSVFTFGFDLATW